jgi:GNAT superfamily N-acetyltransferase
MIIIAPFQPADQTEAKALILNGLVEHWGFLDPTKNPDLDDIAATYANATFLVAWLDGKLVGTGALVPRSPDSAEIVRMSVDRSLRRQGVGRMILQTLVEYARQIGLRQVTLETTATWADVIAFYLNFGFHITHEQDGDIYFALDLT